MGRGIKSLRAGKNQMPRRFGLEVGRVHLHPHCNLIPLLQLNDNCNQAGWCPLSSFHSLSFYIPRALPNKLKPFSPCLCCPLPPFPILFYCLHAVLLYFQHFISRSGFEVLSAHLSWFGLEQGLWNETRAFGSHELFIAYLFFHIGTKLCL